MEIFNTDCAKELLGSAHGTAEAEAWRGHGARAYNTVCGLTKRGQRTKPSLLSAGSSAPYQQRRAGSVRWLRIFAADIFTRLVEEGGAGEQKAAQDHHPSPSTWRDDEVETKLYTARQPLYEQTFFDLA